MATHLGTQYNICNFFKYQFLLQNILLWLKIWKNACRIQIRLNRFSNILSLIVILMVKKHFVKFT